MGWRFSGCDPGFLFVKPNGECENVSHAIVSKIIEFRLRDFKRKLELADTKNRKHFHPIFSEGVKLFSLSFEDMAKTFGMGKETLRRWNKGTQVPWPCMRHLGVYPLFLKMADISLTNLLNKGSIDVRHITTNDLYDTDLYDFQ